MAVTTKCTSGRSCISRFTMESLPTPLGPLTTSTTGCGSSTMGSAESGPTASTMARVSSSVLVVWAAEAV